MKFQRLQPFYRLHSIYTNSISEVERGGEEEATEAYFDSTSRDTHFVGTRT
jgi:hypothetical protein